MRAPATSFAVALLLVALAALAAAACVPRLAGPTNGSEVAPEASSEPSATAATSPVGPAGPTSIPSFVRPTPLPAPTFLAYTVKAGDTLTSIAREYRTTPRSIAFWSRGEHPSLDPESAAYQPDRLKVGWVLLVIPNAVFDEDELPDATPSPTASASNDVSPGPTAS